MHSAMIVPSSNQIGRNLAQRDLGLLGSRHTLEILNHDFGPYRDRKREVEFEPPRSRASDVCHYETQIYLALTINSFVEGLAFRHTGLAPFRGAALGFTERHAGRPASASSRE